MLVQHALFSESWLSPVKAARLNAVNGRCRFEACIFEGPCISSVPASQSRSKISQLRSTTILFTIITCSDARTVICLHSSLLAQTWGWTWVSYESRSWDGRGRALTVRSIGERPKGRVIWRKRKVMVTVARGNSITLKEERANIGIVTIG